MTLTGFGHLICRATNLSSVFGGRHSCYLEGRPLEAEEMYLFHFTMDRIQHKVSFTGVLSFFEFSFISPK